MNQLVGTLTHPITWWVRGWARSSQRDACRNAMVAATALAASRRERDEAQELIDSVLARRARRAGATPPSLPAARLG